MRALLLICAIVAPNVIVTTNAIENSNMCFPFVVFSAPEFRPVLQ